jgi:hexosaminidase
MFPRLFFPFKLFSVLVLVLALAVPPAAHALWPQPRHLQTGPPDSALRLADDFVISLAGVEPNALPGDLLAAVQRTYTYLFNDNLGRLVLGRGSGDLGAIERACTLSRLTLQLGTGTDTDTDTGIDIGYKGGPRL